MKNVGFVFTVSMILAISCTVWFVAAINDGDSLKFLGNAAKWITFAVCAICTVLALVSAGTGVPIGIGGG